MKLEVQYFGVLSVCSCRTKVVDTRKRDFFPFDECRSEVENIFTRVTFGETFFPIRTQERTFGEHCLERSRGHTFLEMYYHTGHVP